VNQRIGNHDGCLPLSTIPSSVHSQGEWAPEHRNQHFGERYQPRVSIRPQLTREPRHYLDTQEECPGRMMSLHQERRDIEGSRDRACRHTRLTVPVDRCPMHLRPSRSGTLLRGQQSDGLTSPPTASSRIHSLTPLASRRGALNPALTRILLQQGTTPSRTGPINTSATHGSMNLKASTSPQDRDQGKARWRQLRMP
jgi:hypothetical protein